MNLNVCSSARTNNKKCFFFLYPVTIKPPAANVYKNINLSKAAQTHTIRKLRAPSKCRECESYVYFNGAECERCGLACHKKCLESLAINCGGKRLMGKMNVFGVSLVEHLRETGRDVPFIVTKCISEMDKKALTVKVPRNLCLIIKLAI